MGARTTPRKRTVPRPTLPSLYLPSPDSQGRIHPSVPDSVNHVNVPDLCLLPRRHRDHLDHDYDVRTVHLHRGQEASRQPSPASTGTHFYSDLGATFVVYSG